jgi:hypothetical protein
MAAVAVVVQSHPDLRFHRALAAARVFIFLFQVVPLQ